MQSIKGVRNWDPLVYLSDKELSQINKQFDSSLYNAECLVFWTGMPRKFVQHWSDQNGLKTLTSAMGPLMDLTNPTSPRHQKTITGWTKYVKGASGRFAEYACQNRRAIVLTNPPPNIYSLREFSTFRHLEEPILKGVFGGPKVIRIDYVHPLIEETAQFRYQVWPLDRSDDWVTFLMRVSKRTKDSKILNHIPVSEESTIKSGMGSRLVGDNKKLVNAQKEAAKGKKAEEEQRKVKAKKDAKKAAKSKKAEEEQRKVKAKKDARKAAERKRTELSTAKTTLLYT